MARRPRRPFWRRQLRLAPASSRQPHGPEAVCGALQGRKALPRRSFRASRGPRKVRLETPRLFGDSAGCRASQLGQRISNFGVNSRIMATARRGGRGERRAFYEILAHMTSCAMNHFLDQFYGFGVSCRTREICLQMTYNRRRSIPPLRWTGR